MSFLPEEEIFVKLGPLVVVVQQRLRIDQRQRDLVERRVYLPVRRYEIAHGKNTLPLVVDLEIIEQHLSMPMLPPPHDRDAIVSRHRRTYRELLKRRAP